MRNVAPTRALARRTRHWLTYAFVIGAVGVFVAVAGMAMFVIPLAAPASQGYSIYLLARVTVLAIGAIIFLIGIGVGIRAISFKTDNDLALVTGNYLAQYLDDRYHFIRNVSKRGLGYIDAVLVGPPGALVFRILDNTGVYANEGANWLKQGPGGWKLAGIEPTREAVQDVKALRQYLAARQLGDVPVFGVVVFTRAEPAVQLAVREPVVPVSTLPTLVANLGMNYLAQERIDAARVSAVVRELYEA